MRIAQFLRRIKKVLYRLRYTKETVKELRARGVQVGENCSVNTNNIDYGHGYLITIGNNVTISDAVLLAHDASTKRITGYSKCGRIVIKDNVFIGYNAIIMPNVTIGENSIIGAGSVILHDVPANVVVAGNPGRVICSVEEFEKKNEELFSVVPHFDTHWSRKSAEQKEQMIKALQNGGYVFDE